MVINMKMYAVIDMKLHKPIAFHKEKRVVLKYKIGYEMSNPDAILRIAKMKRSEFELYDYANLYLVRYGEVYVQTMYLEAAQFDLEPIVDDLLRTHDVLQRVMELSKSKKKVKDLLKADTIILEELDECQKDIYNLDSLESRKQDIEEYRRKTHTSFIDYE